MGIWILGCRPCLHVHVVILQHAMFKKVFIRSSSLIGVWFLSLLDSFCWLRFHKLAALNLDSPKLPVKIRSLAKPLEYV